MTPKQFNFEFTRTTFLVEALKNVPQDPEWHGEGDVYIHTGMVCTELEKIDEFRRLPYEQQNLLILAARMHDIGKVSTTREVDGRIHAHGHARRSAEMLQHFWWENGYELSVEDRRLVLALVRYHARPLHQQDHLEAHVAATSVLVPINLLALLAEADMRGRIASDTPEQLLKIELFRESARELGCYEKSFSYPSAHARWRFMQDPKQIGHMAYDDRIFTVNMTVGLPGAGKTTMIAKVAKNLPVVSLDRIRQEFDLEAGDKSDTGRAVQIFKEELKTRLRLGQPFWIDGTNLIKQFRTQNIDICTKYGAAVYIHHLDRDRRTIFAQNKSRPAEIVVPESVIDRMAQRMEFPDESECHHLLFHA